MRKEAGKFPDDSFLDDTIAHWQKYYGKPLRREQAVEITTNALGFFNLLMEWARKRDETDPPPKPDSN